MGGTDDFGFSAPGGIVMDSFGINLKHLLEVAQAMLQEGREEAHARKRWSSKEHRSSKNSSTQSAIWSKIECKTLDSLPGISDDDFNSGTLESLPELPDAYSIQDNSEKVDKSTLSRQTSSTTCESLSSEH